MKTYAHFLSNGQSQLGSDAWVRLDGRLRVSGLCHEAIAQMERLRVVKPHYNGFEIRKGRAINDNRVIFRSDKVLFLAELETVSTSPATL